MNDTPETREFGLAANMHLDEVYPEVYGELRRLAQFYMRQERSNHTLQPTALVHETYLRLAQQEKDAFLNRTQFLGIAANMMRRILVNHAVKRNRQKREGAYLQVTLDRAVDVFSEGALNLLELEEDERILFVHLTEDYSGWLLLGFANGKVARIPLEAYQTKTNRKKLINAFSVVSPLVNMYHFEEDEDFFLSSDTRKGLVFNSGSVPVKATRTAQGVQIMLSRKGSQVISLQRLSESGITEPKSYRTRTLPAVGSNIRENTLEKRQLRLDEA